MTRGFGAWLMGALMILGGSTVASGQDYSLLLDFETQIRMGAQYDLLDAHCFEGSTAYCIVRGIESAITPEWESQIVRIDDIFGTPTQTLLVSNAQWKALVNGGAATTILSGNHMKIIGDYLQFLDTASDAVYRVHKVTGHVSVFVSNQAIKDFTGLTKARLIDDTAFSPDDEMVFYDQDSDTVLIVDKDGNLGALVTRADFVSLYGYEPINLVAGGMTFDAEGRLYWALTNTGSTGSAGGAIYMRDCDGTLSLVLSEMDIWFGIPDFTFYAVAFNDLFAAPDGYIYFYERADTVDSIVYFDPADPVNTIQVLLSEDDIRAGPAGNREVNVSALNALGSRLTWHHVDRWFDLYTAPLGGPIKTKADFDGSGAVDTTDMDIFEACATGPAVLYDLENLPEDCAVEPDCLGVIPPDFDRDRDVDSADFAILQRSLTIGQVVPQ